MKQAFGSSFSKTAFAALSLLILSFSGKKGGDSFEIYLDGKLLVQQHLAMEKGVQSLQLPQNAADSKLDVYYSHCGNTGKNRTLMVKDEKTQVLKQWHFSDVSAKRSGMRIPLQDVLAVQKNKKAGHLNLFYSSKEIPEGKLLATIE